MGHKEDLDALEANIEKLKFNYDQYFLGFEKRAPEQLRKDVEREVRKYIGIQINNTGLKFRAQNLVQRMATYRQLWDRTLQQIEDGTYKRDIFKANLKSKLAPPKPGAKGGAEVIEDAEIYEEEPSQKYGSVFDAYLKARQQTKENVSGLTYDKLHDVLEKQAQQIRDKFKAKDVEFRVVIEDGKARLKASPKK